MGWYLKKKKNSPCFNVVFKINIKEIYLLYSCIHFLFFIFRSLSKIHPHLLKYFIADFICIIIIFRDL